MNALLCSCVGYIPISKNVVVFIWAASFTVLTYGWTWFLILNDWSHEVLEWLLQISGTFGFFIALVLFSTCLYLFIFVRTGILIRLDTGLVSLGRRDVLRSGDNLEVQTLGTVRRVVPGYKC